VYVDFLLKISRIRYAARSNAGGSYSSQSTHRRINATTDARDGDPNNPRSSPHGPSMQFNQFLPYSIISFASNPGVPPKTRDRCGNRGKTDYDPVDFRAPFIEYSDVVCDRFDNLAIPGRP
jgi:hypothetical protein